MSANDGQRYQEMPLLESDPDKPFAQEGYALMGAVFEVHKQLGGGLLEEVYQQSLEIELELRGISYQSKAELCVYYKNRKLDKRYVPDLLVSEHIVVELKSVRELLSEHEAQLINYMRITRQPVGYLINFGPTAKVDWKRFVKSRLEAIRNVRVRPWDRQRPVKEVYSRGFSCCIG